MSAKSCTFAAENYTVCGCKGNIKKLNNQIYDMKKLILIMATLFCCMNVVFGQHHFIYRQIILHRVMEEQPGIEPTSLTNPLPCDIEAYQTRDDVEIIVNDVSMTGFYQVSVFDHHLDRVYNASVLFYDGATAFISTDDWPEDTYYLQIIVPGGWLEGEFEIDW